MIFSLFSFYILPGERSVQLRKASSPVAIKLVLQAEGAGGGYIVLKNVIPYCVNNSGQYLAAGCNVWLEDPVAAVGC